MREIRSSAQDQLQLSLPPTTAGHFGVLAVSDFCGDLVGFGAAAGGVDQCQYALDHLRIRIVAFGRQNDDGSARFPD